MVHDFVSHRKIYPCDIRNIYEEAENMFSMIVEVHTLVYWEFANGGLGHRIRELLFQFKIDFDALKIACFLPDYDKELNVSLDRFNPYLKLIGVGSSTWL